MAASSSNNGSETKTLKDTLSVAVSSNGSTGSKTPIQSDENPGSTEQMTHGVQEESVSKVENGEEEIKPSDTQLTDDTSLGEKRKRESPEPLKTKEPEGSVHPMWKTSFCKYFRSKTGLLCSHGDACRFAHSEEELRPRPDNTYDPASERAKKLMKLEKGVTAQVLKSSEGDLITENFDDDDVYSDAGLTKCLVHLPTSWDSDNLNKFLREQGVVFKSAKKKKGMTVGFVSFEGAEHLKSAMEDLDGRFIGKKTLKVANVLPRSFEKKAISLNVSEDGDRVDEQSAMEGLISAARCARDVVTPLAHMAYGDQLELKKNSIMQTLKRLTRNARKACPKGVALPEWILKAWEIGGLPCKLEGILESPVVDGYRNKCEFSVGYSLQGKPTVGFSIGTFREGVTAVEEPLDCLNISRIACQYASIFQEFLQQSSFPVWHRFNNTGFWRQLTVREGRKSGNGVEVGNFEGNIAEVMLIVQVSTEGIGDEQLNNELERMAQAFAVGAAANSPSLPLTALVVQDHKGISNVAPPDAPLRPLPIPRVGTDSVQDATDNIVQERIHDHISNLRFSISPTAFFQVNTLAAEKLYSLAGDWAGLGPDTLLFDVCCGTGTIGLTLAHRVGMVVGIEMNASAVSDAHRNAEINGINNCRFVCGKAESVIGSLLKEYLNVPEKQNKIQSCSENNEKEITSTNDNNTSLDKVLKLEESLENENGKDASVCLENKKQESECGGNNSTKQFKNVVAIVDPPRNGLHSIVLKALRTHPRLRRLVYISCNPESLVANAIELCTPCADSSEKGGNKNNNRLWWKMSAASLARQRTKSMPQSEPFQPVKALAVDLFPHTDHCEMVMLLER